MGFSDELLDFLALRGYQVTDLKVRQVAVGEPGAGQGFVMRIKIRAEKML